MTPPPSSSPSQSGHPQSTAAKRAIRQHENEYREPDAPLPKRRRKGPSAVGQLDFVSLLSDDDAKDGINGQTRPSGNPEVPPIRQKSTATSPSRSRGMSSAKALSKAAVGRPIADAEPWHISPTPDQAVPPDQWPQQQWQPPLMLAPAPAPAPAPWYSQPEWTQPPPMSQPEPERRNLGVDMSSMVPPNSYLPGWNYTFPNDGSCPPRNFDITPPSQPPGHHYQMSVPSQQNWPYQQWHGYSRPGPPSGYLEYVPQAYQRPPPGTASYPIDLDGPTQNISAPVYAPSTVPASQLPTYGLSNNPVSLFPHKQDTMYGNCTSWPPLVTQPAAIPQPIMAPQHAQNVNKQTARKRTQNPSPVIPTYEPVLCPEQEDLVRLIESGKNVFYTGSAGCGKSTVLKAFVNRLKAQGKRVRIVAPTGRAALNVGGTTTWTFAGWTPDSHKLTIEQLQQRAHGKNVFERLTKTDVLVIDEISMVESLHLERLNILMKTARHQPRFREQPAFGGCQIVVTGDFCQLPPVKPFQHCLQCGKEMTQKAGKGGKLLHVCKQHGEYPDEDKWAFRSKAWRECNFEHVHLKKIHRQNDQTFISMLQKCRLGISLTEPEIKLLMHHECRTAQATKLFSTRREASDVNRERFENLRGINHAYWCHDSFFWNDHYPQLQWKNRRNEWGSESGTSRPPNTKKPLQALEDHRWGKCVQLKQGMLVVLLTNLDLEAGLCNGSQGLIKGFENYDPNKMPIRETYDARGKKKIEAQPGQRAVRGAHADVQEAEIKTFIASDSAPIKKWPVVRFHNGVIRTVYAECSISQLGDEEPHCLLARTQIPLAPAWAMTIHKSQSLTLDRVIVNLSKAFEEGQVYVALSRATGLGGLKIEGDEGFLRSKLMVNTEVSAFLKEKFGDIYGVNAAEDVEAEPPLE